MGPVLRGQGPQSSRPHVLHCQATLAKALRLRADNLSVAELINKRAGMAPLKLAIIGAGPSSFYVASRLLSLLPQSSAHASSLKIHLYDRLWAPYGLVRYGVAPDHPEVKVSAFEQQVNA